MSSIPKETEISHTGLVTTGRLIRRIRSWVLSLVCLTLATTIPLAAQEVSAPATKPAVAEIMVDASQTGVPISPYIYGQFIEHLGRCIYGGIWAEMLEDRKFYFPAPAPGNIWRTTR